jgi:hypothetical protein
MASDVATRSSYEKTWHRCRKRTGSRCQAGVLLIRITSSHQGGRFYLRWPHRRPPRPAWGWMSPDPGDDGSTLRAAATGGRASARHQNTRHRTRWEGEAMKPHSPALKTSTKTRLIKAAQCIVVEDTKLIRLETSAGGLDRSIGRNQMMDRRGWPDQKSMQLNRSRRD